MLLESIKLENFRQFRDVDINFAQGLDGKNVTIVLGDNGSGKTTFAQAFTWCLYGETEFSDKCMLNKRVEMEMKPEQEQKVQVILKLTHGEVSYTLMREQTYRKDYTGRVKCDNTIFDIAKKDKTGTTTYIKKHLCEGEVQTILPKELSKYFFFDGERIDRMSKDILIGKKATDFAEAVKGLLGLNAIYAAIQHFNPRSKYSVIGSYEASYNANSNKEMADCNQKIYEYSKNIEEIENELATLENEIEEAKIRKSQSEKEISTYEEGKKLQEEKNRILKQINSIESLKREAIKEVSRNFNTAMNAFFSLSLMNRSLEFLDNKDFSGKDIPNMTAKTIEWLLENKECVCGTHLTEGSIAYDKVKKLFDFLPPKSLNSTVSAFKKKSRERVNAEKNLYEYVTEKLANISKRDDELIDLYDELSAIDSKLNGQDVSAYINEIAKRINVCDKLIIDNSEKIKKLCIKKGSLVTDLERVRTRRSDLSLLDKNNKKIEIYKTYAEKIYEDIKYTYNSSETRIREELERTINEIFKTIYEGGLSLTIDEKYHISVYADEYSGDVETSTAQSISVIFAFITGIIQMARKNRTDNNEEAKLLSSEPYPLVMDAPLSAFDKRRIKTVCQSLPSIAEQVIIFIKDTDGNLAEDYMGEKIGARYQFDKKNEFETSFL